ncbi:MAG: PAS domain S-box protein, partial [Nitrospira sp.]|nr:PAS domain S-box protein [Nitrospira sp.]
MARKPDKSTKGAALRAQAEQLLQATKRDVAAMPINDLQQLVHELQVHQVELDMQNDELRQSQVELEVARVRYVDLYDFSPIAHLTLDTSGTIVEANLRAATLLGPNRRELIGQPLACFVEPEDQAIFQRHCQDVVKTGTRHTCEVRLRNETGPLCYIYLESLAVHGEPGPITHWRTALLDISERKREENAEQRRALQLKICQEELYTLTKNQEFHAGPLTHSLQMVTECATRTPAVERGSVWFLDETGSFLLLHDLYEATAKRHTSGMRLSRSLFPSYFHALKTGTCTIDAEDALTDPRTCEFAEAYLIPLNIGAMLDAPIWRDGQVVGVLCLEQIGGARIWTKEEKLFASSLAAMVTIALEADERRKAQDRLEQRVVERTGELQRVNLELHRATTHLHAILAQSPLAIIELDESGFVKRWNNAATQTFGWTEEEVLGRELSYLPQMEKEESSSLWASVMQGEMGQNKELLLKKKDGVPVNVSVWSIGLRDPDGSPTGSIGFLIDITERIRLETRGRQAQKMEAVGQLAGGVAHDFNNLLTVINGYSALLLDQMPPEDSRHMMAVETLRAGERAGELTKQLLAFSRKQVLLLQPLNLNDSLQSISSMLSRLLGEEVKLAMDLAPDLWSINGDTGQLNQVTMNLTINARDAMPHGGTVAIATRNVSVTSERPDRHRMMPPGDYVHVSVRDTGHGMSPETLSHLFEPFFTTKEVGQGTGLGLATVYGIVKQSQGYIFADSALNQGATFHLYYPRVLTAPAVAETPSVPHRRGSETLLVVEDQDMVRTFVAQSLNSYGYRVIEAASGEEALRVAA